MTNALAHNELPRRTAQVPARRPGITTDMYEDMYEVPDAVPPIHAITLYHLM